MKIENAAVALLLLIMLITILCGGINLYRLCHSLPYLPHLVERCVLYATAVRCPGLFLGQQ